MEHPKNKVHRVYRKDENAKNDISCGSGGNRTGIARLSALNEIIKRMMERKVHKIYLMRR